MVEKKSFFHDPAEVHNIGCLSFRSSFNFTRVLQKGQRLRVGDIMSFHMKNVTCGRIRRAECRCQIPPVLAKLVLVIYLGSLITRGTDGASTIQFDQPTTRRPVRGKVSNSRFSCILKTYVPHFHGGFSHFFRLEDLNVSNI
jgi:hypothetical protein